MFGMGVALRFSDFACVWQQKHLVGVAVLLQYTCMPILAVGLSSILNLPKEMMIGMVVVGACPGGTASNVMAYLAKANVALSVSLTLCSTILAPLLTPMIIYLVLSQKVDISFLSMVKSIFWIVCFPLFDGLVLRHFFSGKLERILPVFPSISIISITAIIACVVALNKALILSFPIAILVAVLLHNSIGYFVGFQVARFLNASVKDARTIAFEIGMQNSGLGVSLANQFFGAASALPGALFSLIHNLTGISLAKWWVFSNGQSNNTKSPKGRI